MKQQLAQSQAPKETHPAYTSHTENSGLVGIPRMDRAHFEPGSEGQFAAEHPEYVIARPAIVLPEK